MLATVLGAEAVSQKSLALGLASASMSHEIIEAAAYGVSAQASAEENSAALLKIRARMRSSDSAFDLILPDGRLDILTGRWLQGVRDVRVRGGKDTQLRNVGVSEKTTECVPLVINQDYFLNNAGSIPGFGEFTSGDRIRSVTAKSSVIRLLNSDSGRSYRPGLPILIYGYNQDSQGYPPSIRYFERNVVANADAGVIELITPLRYDYDARWVDIAQNADYVGENNETGAARVLSLDRPGFRVARNIELDDLAFVSSREHHDENDVTSLDGSLYAFSADRIVCNRVRVNGYFYPSASGTIIVNDSYIRFVENDKLVDYIEYNRSEIGFFSNGPAVNRIVVNDSTIEEPIPIISCRAAEFNDVTFLGKRRPASAFVTLSFSTPMDSIVFNRPRLVSSAGGVLPLTTGGGVVRVKVTAAKANVLYANFSGINDPIPRGLSVGSVLRSESGEPLFDVTGLWLENGETAIRVKARNERATGQVDQILLANICKRLSITDPIVLGVGASTDRKFSSPRSSSNASIDVSVQLKADNTKIFDAHHNDSMIAGRFDFGESSEQHTFDVTIHRRARELIISVGHQEGVAELDSDGTLLLSGLDYTGHTVWRGSIDTTAPGIRTIGENQVVAMARDKVQPFPSVRIVRLRAICTGHYSAVAKNVDFKILF
ncbi:hypothetical protein [Paraburkholderia sp. RL17-337-BIB-A]|uniref:hypothetical protein n=1 Tax=Paraburkholderia sp. RL17-337-BIB-A TaxID=3031636 RepID=UPI0038BB6157